MVFAYLRVSTTTQENSLDAQRMAIEAYLAPKGVTSDQIRFFTDWGVSGAKGSRPGLDQMLAAIPIIGCKTVVCYSISRLGRSVINLLALIQQLEAMEVEIHSVTESLDLRSPFGRLILNLLASLAQMERELIVSRVRSGLEAARKRGKVLGRPRTRNSEAIRQLKQNGYSQRAIAKLLGYSRNTVQRELASMATNTCATEYVAPKPVAS